MIQTLHSEVSISFINLLKPLFVCTITVYFSAVLKGFLVWLPAYCNSDSNRMIRAGNKTVPRKIK